MSTIESLELEIRSNSKDAVNGIDALTQSLAKLKTATTGFSGLKSIATNMRDLANASKSIDASSVNAVTGLAKAIQLLNGVKVSANIANQIGAISTSLQSANFSGGEAKMQELVTALKPLQELSKSNLSSFVTPLKNLPKVFAELDKIDMSAFAAKMQEVATAMKPLADEMDKVAKGFSSFPAKIQKLLTATDKIPSANKKASVSFTDLFHKASLVINSFKAIGNSIYSFIKASSDHTEAVNLFTVSLGKYASGAKEYAESVSDIMGINTTEWLESQGIFMTLATGFGVASDRAQIMSQNLTQLGYDLSSFFNIDVEDAMQKLQSGLSGELEPLRRIGYDLSQAKLEATALELGIDKSVSSMTQAEKAQLRYYAIMTQVTTAQGDMARTLDAPANQMRVLKAQFEMAAKSIGNIFIPALQAILPYAIAVTKIVRELADGLASLVGFEPTGVDSAIASAGEAASDTSTALEEGAESAKKLKSYMLGFDELNVINPNSEESADDASSFEFALPEYDFLSGATNEKIEGIITTIKEFFEPLTELIKMTVEWAKELDLESISKEFEELGSSLEIVGGKIFDNLSWVYEDIMLPLAEWSIEEGLPTVIGLLATALDTLGAVMAPVHEGLKELKKDLDPIVEWIGEVVIVALEGVASVFEKVSRVFSEKAPEITSIFTGLGDVISKLWAGLEPIADAVLYVFGLLWDVFGDFAAINWTYMIDTVSSFVDIIAGFANGDWDQIWSGIVGIFEAYWTSVIDKITAVWDFMVELFTPVAKWFDTNVIQPVSKFFKGLWEDISKFFSNLWDDIVAVWDKVAKWFDETVVQPIVAFFAPIVEGISDFFEGCWLIVQAVWLVVATWFNDTVVTPVADFFEGLWKDVSGFFTSLWDDVKKIWKGVSTWFDTTVVTPVVDYFKGVWTDVSGFFSSLWEDIKAVWGVVSTWFSDTITEPIKTVFESACGSIEGFFTSLWLSIRKGVANAMNGVIGGIESAINWIIGGINGLIGGFDKIVKWAADILGEDWGGMTLVKEVSFSRITVPTYAEGGFPAQGQMFIAREAGAEMVGSIGRRTAVANNDQIVSGIAGGVAEANEEQNVLLREQNSLLRAILEKDSGVYLDGRSLTNSVEKYQRERGRVLITGGVV